ncbi:hypothetical protein PF008_g20244 [Phytophthora fragariae]|uniref:Uncharacterized protein n=1 Tax=Phytophthora fragariae TaxID=53985 RepID=A0A6G0R1A3_9STRA|nr:hypothetical protein PF008_g20244 [Phytophthora fragariae]
MHPAWGVNKTWTADQAALPSICTEISPSVGTLMDMNGGSWIQVGNLMDMGIGSWILVGTFMDPDGG